MLPSAAPLVPLRTTVPRERADLLPRAALVTRLRAAVTGRRVVLVCAPGGYGKTAAVAQAVRGLAAGIAVSWLEAAADDDAPELLRHLVAALEPHDLPWRVSPQALFGLSHSDGGLREAARRVAEALANTDAPHGVIVLDDMHRWTDPRIQMLLAELVSLLPERWTLVMITREEPPGLARLRVEDQLAEFREADLRLDADEARQLAELLRAPLPQPELDELMLRTQGWPAGLAMAMLALRGHGLAEGFGNRARRAMFDFMAEEVLADLPQAMQLFLLRCAVLPELTEDRCRRASGDAQTPAWLDELMRRDLFVSTLEQPQLTLRLHDMFRDFLEQELVRRLPDEMPALLRRVAEGEPDLATAVGFLLRAGAVEEAERRLVDSATQLLQTGNGEQLLRLISQFPGASGGTLSPDLAYLKGLCASFRFGMGTVMASMRVAADGFERAHRKQQALKARLLGLIAAVNACRVDEALRFWDPARPDGMSPDTALLVSCRDFAQAMETGPAGEAARHLDAAVDVLSSDCPPADWVFLFPSMFAFVGNAALHAPMTRLVQLLQQQASLEQPLLHGVTLVLRAWRAFWRLDLAEARSLATEAESEARWLGNLSFIFVPARMLRAIDAALQGRCAEAQHIMQRLVDASVAAAPSEQQPELLLVQLQGLVAVTCGDWPLVKQALGRMQAEGHRYRMTYIEVCAAVLQGEVALHEGRAAEAAALLRDATPAAEATERWGLHARTRAAWASAELKQGAPVAAWDALQPVVRAARASGEVLGLMLRGPEALHALAEGLAGTAPADDVAFLRTQAERASALRAPAAALAPAASGVLMDAASPPQAVLSARELEVLALVVRGRSNKLIARDLGLSPHTVKRHIARMLERTGLSSRGQLAAWNART